MRTTVAIDDGLLKTAKQHAEARKMTLGQVIEEGLRLYLARTEESAQFGPPLPVFTRGTGMAPGIDPTSNASMLDALDALDEEEDQDFTMHSRAAG
jgi:hypothetical protein